MLHANTTLFVCYFISVSVYCSPEKVDLTLTYGGWPKNKLDVTLNGTNLNCAENLATTLFVWTKPKEVLACRTYKMCPLKKVTKVNTEEACTFTCDCLYTDPCVIDFIFLNAKEEEICEVDIPDEFIYRKIP